MKRALTAAATLCLVALGITSSASARTAITTSCPSSSALVANVSYGVAGESVQGTKGNVWATADYTRTLLVYRVGASSYCVLWRDTGRFTTAAGASPGGRGKVVAGLTGTLTRTAVTNTFSATWQPSLATSGYLGTFATPIDLSAYLGGVQDLDLVWTTASYVSQANGCWANRTGYPSIGDILSSY